MSENNQNTNNESSKNITEESVKFDPLTGAKTTGHCWDDDIEEFDNPLPRWWLWGFYASVVFAIAYWVLFPSWPIGFMEKGFFPGVKEITYVNQNGQEQTSHWNMRAKYAYDVQNDPASLKRKEMLGTLSQSTFEEVANNPETNSLVLTYGKNVFADYCAGCHQKGGQGIVGKYPNLIDDAWLWGDDIAQIEKTIQEGRIGKMPAHKDSLSALEIDQVANYALSFSGEPHDTAQAIIGKTVFETKGCAGCHTNEGVGVKDLGSANLTDKIWTIADVNGASSQEAKLQAVKNVIVNGVNRQMPAWSSRLSDEEIKVLVFYVKLLSQRN